jgi:hypothetical protein
MGSFSMPETQISLSPPEREFLIDLLRQTLGDSRVEVRRTEFSSDFRHQLQEQEGVLRGLIDKLSSSAKA